MNKPYIIGHRGAKGLAPENTLKAFQTALDLKVDGVELDVHLSSDGELVVFHDAIVNFNDTDIRNINECSLEELKSIKIEGEHEIPTLREVLNLIDGKCFVNIELKGQNTAQAVVTLIREYINKKNWNYYLFIVSSFDWNMLEQVKQLDGKIDLGILTEFDLDSAVEFANKTGARLIFPHYKLLNQESIGAIKICYGFQIIPWTVNEPDDIQLLKSLHVEGFITDFPDRI